MKIMAESMWFKSKLFHQTAKWQKLSRKHKAMEKANNNWKCVECGYTGWNIESGHILPASKFKLSRLWMMNLNLQCGDKHGNGCNKKLGARIILTPKSGLLLLCYFIVWLIRLLGALSILSLIAFHHQAIFALVETVVRDPLFHSLYDSFLSILLDRSSADSV